MLNLVKGQAASMESTIGAACGLEDARICLPGDAGAKRKGVTDPV